MIHPEERSFNRPATPDAVRPNSLKERLHTIIFEAETPSGFIFDVLLLVAIFASVVVACLDTVESLSQRFGPVFYVLEWCFTVLFTIEYLLRLYCVRRPLKYAFSFFGIIDLLAVLPTYILLFYQSGASFTVVRALRLLRVFRIFKLVWFMNEADELGQAILNARAKVVVFFGFVLIVVTIAGTLMYEIENYGRAVTGAPGEGFRNIPESIYWAIVTMTTVGYGDIVPHTVLGKMVASLLILIGYSLIIVPTGFVSAEFVSAKRRVTTISCPSCSREGHDPDARYCKYCGENL